MSSKNGTGFVLHETQCPMCFPFSYLLQNSQSGNCCEKETRSVCCQRSRRESGRWIAKLVNFRAGRRGRRGATGRVGRGRTGVSCWRFAPYFRDGRRLRLVFTTRRGLYTGKRVVSVTAGLGVTEMEKTKRISGEPVVNTSDCPLQVFPLGLLVNCSVNILMSKEFQYQGKIIRINK